VRGFPGDRPLPVPRQVVGRPAFSTSSSPACGRSSLLLPPASAREASLWLPLPRGEGRSEGAQKRLAPAPPCRGKRCPLPLTASASVFPTGNSPAGGCTRGHGLHTPVSTVPPFRSVAATARRSLRTPSSREDAASSVHQPAPGELACHSQPRRTTRRHARRGRVLGVSPLRRPLLRLRPRSLQIFLDEIERWLNATVNCLPEAAAHPSLRPRLGAVSFLHRFGSALNRHVHLHACVTDGLFMPVQEGVAFLPARPGAAPGQLAARHAGGPGVRLGPLRPPAARRRHRGPRHDQRAADRLRDRHGGLGVVGMRADPAAGGRWHGDFQGRRGLVASVLCSAVGDATPIVPLAGRTLVPAHRSVPTMPQVLPWRSKPTRPAREKFCSRTRL
jgi:hypothetical protein